MESQKIEQTSGEKRRSPSCASPPSGNMFFHPPHLDADAAGGDKSSSDILSAAATAVGNPSLAGFEEAGLRVFTVGTLQPREDVDDWLNTSPGPNYIGSGDGSHKSRSSMRGASATSEENSKSGLSVPFLEDLPAGMPKVDLRANSSSSDGNKSPSPFAGPSGTTGNARSSTPSDGGSNLLRVRRSTFVPGWAVPPRVLLVDDDAVCRKLSSKFLQVFGCAIDVAVDGVNAVNKMNLEKYDLVLMVSTRGESWMD